MDDNVRNTSAPAVLGICYMAGYLGGFTGKMLGSACLQVGVSPGHELGAWWLGWPIITLVHSSLALMFLLLPYKLHNTEEKQIEMTDDEQGGDNPEDQQSLIAELWQDLKRLASNKVLLCDSLAMSFFLFASTNRSYTSKFVEFQFQVSPSEASLFSGSSSMIGMISALAISILVISFFKPPARVLAAYNFFTDILAVIIGLCFIFVDCDHHGINQPDQCYQDCHCSSVFKPVCDSSTSVTYFSPCSAGCSLSSAYSNMSTIFTDCHCTSSGSVEAGYCQTDCRLPLMVFLITQFVLNLITGLGRIGNLLVHVRCVEKEDKALGMAIQEVFLALIAFIPGELLFGSLVDSACSLWTQDECGHTGHCLGYNLTDLRTKLFGVSAAGFLFSAIFDGLVWRGVTNLKIY